MTFLAPLLELENCLLLVMMLRIPNSALWWWTLVGVSSFTKEVEFLRLRGVWVPLSLPPASGECFSERKHSRDFSKFPTGAIENIHLFFSKAPNPTELSAEAPDAGLRVRCA